MTLPSGSTIRVCAESPDAARTVKNSVHIAAARDFVRLELIVEVPCG
jgi:hypothetical protein